MRLYPVFERPVGGNSPGAGAALARVVERHPALAPLMDFHSPDPEQIAREVGMVYAYEEDGEDDLDGIDFGPDEWFEPSVGLVVVRQALRAVRHDPGGVPAAVYDPGLRAEAVIADLEALENALVGAQQHETRFRLVLGV